MGTRKLFCDLMLEFSFVSCVFKFLRHSVDEKHLMRFQGEISVFKLLQRNVDGEYVDQLWERFVCLYKFYNHCDRARTDGLPSHTADHLSHPCHSYRAYSHTRCNWRHFLHTCHTTCPWHTAGSNMSQSCCYTRCLRLQQRNSYNLEKNY